MQSKISTWGARRLRRIAVALGLGATLLALGSALVFFPVTVLTVMGENGETALRGRVRPETILRLGFTHSSEHVRVESTFQIDSGELRSVETRMEGLGPGLPGASAAPATKTELISQDAQSYESLALLVTPSTGHWVALGSRRADLSSLVPKERAAYRFYIRLEEANLIAVIFMESG